MKKIISLLALLAFTEALATDVLIPADKATIGNKTATTKELRFNNALGTGNPGVRGNASSAKLEFSHDGITWTNVGSGGGGGGGFNLLTSDDNSGFEDCSGASCPQWTASGGTVGTETTNELFGTKSATFDASALSQTFSSNLKTVPVGLQGGNCLAAISYVYATGSNGDYKLQVYDGTTVLSELSLDVASSTTPAFLGFGCPSSGSVRVRIIAGVANPGVITLDGTSNANGVVHLGSNILLAQVSNAQFIGSAYIAGTASCVFSTTSSSFVAYSTVAACPGPTVELNPGPGVIQTTDADLARFTVNGLSPGDYRVQFSFMGTGNSGSSAECYAVNDGTSTNGRMCLATSGGNDPVSVEAYFRYTSSGNKTFEVYGSSLSATNFLTNQDSNNRIQFSIFKLPSSPQTAIQGIDTTGWYVDANIAGANPSLGTGAQTAYVGIENSGLTMTVNSGSIGAQIPCSSTNAPTGTTCSVGDESLGVVFDLPKAGSVLACASFGVNQPALGAPLAFQIVETPTNAQTITQEGKGRVALDNQNTASNAYPTRVCGVFPFSSVGTKALRLMYEQEAQTSAPTVLADASATAGQRDVHWEVYPINQQIPMPYLVKQLQSPSTSIMQHATSYITNSGSPTITRQDGSFISALVDNGVGDVTANFTASTWSSVPNCSCHGVEETGDTDTVSCSVDKTTAPSSSTYRFRTRLGGTLTDRDFSISCTGPKQ